MLVIKRDGVRVEFDKTKIKEAINKAFLEVDGEECKTTIAKDIADDIECYCNHSILKEISIEEIQNIVISKLRSSERPDVAQSYINYRKERSRIRNKNSALMKAYSKKLRGRGIENQNANVDEHSFGGRVGEASDVISKQVALDDYVSKMARDNHENNMIYIHDLNSYAVGMHNCLSIPFDDLLANGFTTRQTDVRPAGSVNTAMQLVAVIFQLQSLQQFGGVSATHLDWTMVPYVRKSFYKHFKDGVKYLNGEDSLSYLMSHFLDGMDIVKMPIASYDNPTVGKLEKTTNHWMLHNPEWQKAYEYAMDMTEKEIHQAVEGLYHNLK